MESFIPLVMVDLMGNTPKTPSCKPRKKRKKTKPSVERAQKKAKLLASAMSAVIIAKVYFELLFDSCFGWKFKIFLHCSNVFAFISLLL